MLKNFYEADELGLSRHTPSTITNDAPFRSTTTLLDPRLQPDEMPSVLGKRKARAPAPERSEAELEAAQALFRKHFEAKFDPLPEAAPVRAEQENEEDLRSESSDDSEWDGLSGDEDDGRYYEVTFDPNSIKQANTRQSG